MVHLGAIDPPELTIDVVASGDVVRVVVTGDVDAATAGQLRSSLEQVVDTHRPKLVVLDCADMAFLDAAGITALIRAREHARWLDGEIRLLNPRRNVTRVLAMVGLDKLFGVSSIN